MQDYSKKFSTNVFTLIEILPLIELVGLLLKYIHILHLNKSASKKSLFS